MVKNYFPLAQMRQKTIIFFSAFSKVLHAKDCCQTRAFYLFVREIWEDRDDPRDPLLSI